MPTYYYGSNATNGWVEWSGSSTADWSGQYWVNTPDYHWAATPNNEPTPRNREETERREREAEERQKERDAAVAAAEAILAEHLEETYGKEFAEEAKENDFIALKSQIHEGQEYRIGIQKYGDWNIEVRNNGERQHDLCVHPRGSFPRADIALCLLLWLESDEEQLLEVANVHH